MTKSRIEKAQSDLRRAEAVLRAARRQMRAAMAPGQPKLSEVQLNGHRFAIDSAKDVVDQKKRYLESLTSSGDDSPPPAA